MQKAVDSAYAKFKDLKEGKNADYIPALAKVDPNLFGIAVVTADGKVYTAGDLKTEVGRLPPGDYRAVAFSPGGRRIVSVGAEESVVRVWDAERLLPLLTLQDTDSHLGGVTVTAEGQIVAGRTGGGLTIWETQIRRR